MRLLCIFTMLFFAIAPASAQVRTGIDVLQQENFSTLRLLAAKHAGQLRLGILTNSVGRDARGRRTIDILRQDAEAAVRGLKVARLFSPEHGIDAAFDRSEIGDDVDRPSGLPIVSLYGSTEAQRRPSDQQLAGLD